MSDCFVRLWTERSSPHSSVWCVILGCVVFVVSVSLHWLLYHAAVESVKKCRCSSNTDRVSICFSHSFIFVTMVLSCHDSCQDILGQESGLRLVGCNDTLVYVTRVCLRICSDIVSHSKLVARLEAYEWNDD